MVTGFLGDDGYPLNREGASIASLFESAIEVNHFFPESPDGTWEFDSTQCFASLHGDSFILYHELGTVDTNNSSLDHGQFLPFNDLTEGVYSSIHPNMPILSAQAEEKTMPQ